MWDYLEDDATIGPIVTLVLAIGVILGAIAFVWRLVAGIVRRIFPPDPAKVRRDSLRKMGTYILGKPLELAQGMGTTRQVGVLVMSIDGQSDRDAEEPLPPAHFCIDVADGIVTRVIFTGPDDPFTVP